MNSIATPVTVERSDAQGKVILYDDNGRWLADVHSKQADSVSKMLNEHAALCEVASAAEQAWSVGQIVGGSKLAIDVALSNLRAIRKSGGE